MSANQSHCHSNGNQSQSHCSTNGGKSQVDWSPNVKESSTDHWSTAASGFNLSSVGHQLLPVHCRSVFRNCSWLSQEATAADHILYIALLPSITKFVIITAPLRSWTDEVELSGSLMRNTADSAWGREDDSITSSVILCDNLLHSVCHRRAPRVNLSSLIFDHSLCSAVLWRTEVRRLRIKSQPAARSSLVTRRPMRTNPVWHSSKEDGLNLKNTNNIHKHKHGFYGLVMHKLLLSRPE